MLLINDGVINSMDNTFPIRTYEYIAKWGNISKLAGILDLGQPVQTNNYVNIYRKNDKTYKIYNASVDDKLLDIIDYHIPSSIDVKICSPMYQYCLDTASINLNHGVIKTWEKALERQRFLTNELILPFMKKDLKSEVKFFKEKISGFYPWLKLINIMERKIPFSEFSEKFDFETMLSLSSGESYPLYSKLYIKNHKDIIEKEFDKLHFRQKIEAISNLIAAYVCNEYILNFLDVGYTEKEITNFFKETCMRIIQDKSFNDTIRIFIKLNYFNIMNDYDGTFYAVFKNYINLATDKYAY